MMKNPILSFAGLDFEVPFTTPITLQEIPRKALTTLNTVSFMYDFKSPDNDPHGLRTLFKRMNIRLDEFGCVWTNILSYSDHAFIASSFYHGELSDYFLIFTSNGLRFAYRITSEKRY